MKIPRPSIESRIARWRELAGAHRGDPDLYAADHQRINQLLTLREQRIGAT